MRDSMAKTSPMDRWPVHCEERMLYLGDDTAFEPHAGKTNEQKKDDPRGEHYYCEMCKSHQWVLPKQGGEKNDKNAGTLFAARP